MNRIARIVAVVIPLIFSSWAAADCVVLLHGLARTSNAMNKLASALAAHNYKVANVDYPSRQKPIEELAPIAVSAGLRSCGTDTSAQVHFVTHSMGGILVRHYLKFNEIKNLGHVVMIAPHNDRIRDVP